MQKRSSEAGRRVPVRFRTITAPLVAIGLAVTIATTGLGDPLEAVAPPDPYRTEANVTRLVSSVLENSQFAHRRFDDTLARQFLDGYLDSLDGSRSLFLKEDLDEFARYLPTLPRDVRDTGDTHAARAIFARYLERLEQRNAYMAEALRSPTFDFTGHDVYSLDREHAQRPRDRSAARALWREQLRAEYLQAKLGDQPPERIASTLRHRYAQQLEIMRSLRNDEVLQIYLEALAQVYDPHSDYLGHEQMANFSVAMDLSLVGIGATLEDSDGYCKLRELVPGGPAARSALLRAGDRIVAVAQPGQPPVDVVNLPLSRVVELIRGPKGSTVTLKYLAANAPDGAPAKTATLVRDDIELEKQEAKATLVDLPADRGQARRIGVIDLPSFYSSMGEPGVKPRSAAADVARLLGKLEAEHVQGVVLDLRRNGGGSLGEAIQLTGLFIRKGPVVQTRDPAGKIEIDADTDPAVVYDGPLVVLTSRLSASASEILAGALKDYGRALIVGDTSTFGKGTVQSVLPLGRIMDRMGLEHAYDPGALKVTISQFYRPSGASTQIRGVASDIVVPSFDELSDVSESTLKGPLPWDHVAPAKYDRLNRVEPYLLALRQRSTQRVSTEEEFAVMGADMARLKQRFATKAVSLNEADRRTELADAKVSREARERSERVLRATWPTTYPITLENASSPGLPPPIMARPKDDRDRTRPPAAGSPLADDGDEASARAASDDAVLEETERILSDYVELRARSPRGQVVAARQ